MDFSEALKEIKAGKALHRKGWSSPDMFVYLVPAATYPAQTDIAKAEFGDEVPYRAYLAIRTVDKQVATWVPSVGDVLADDWQVKE